MTMISEASPQDDDGNLTDAKPPKLIITEDITYSPDDSGLLWIRDHRTESGFTDTASIYTADENSPWARKAVLCLDGGGVRGLSSLLILARLMKKIQEMEQNSKKRPSYNSDDMGEANSNKMTDGNDFVASRYFDYIGGTSTGGVIAIMLGRLRMNVEDCIKAYKELLGQTFGNSRTHRKLLGLQRFERHKIESEILQNLRPMNPSPEESDDTFYSDSARCRTIICSMESYSSKGFLSPRLLRSYPVVIDKQSSNPLAQKFAETSIWQAARAASAAPSYFKSVKTSASLNNPSIEMYKEVVKRHAEKSPKPVKILVSLGCGSGSTDQSKSTKAFRWKSQTYRLDKRLSIISHQIDNYMSNICYDEQFSYYRLDVSKTLPLNIIKLNEWKPKDSGLKTIAQIENYTNEYLDSPKAVSILEECATELIELRKRRSETMRWERFAFGTFYKCVQQDCSYKQDKYATRNALLDHLRKCHNVESPGINNYDRIQSLLDRGRSNTDSTSSSNTNRN